MLDRVLTASEIIDQATCPSDIAAGYNAALQHLKASLADSGAAVDRVTRKGQEWQAAIAEAEQCQLRAAWASEQFKAYEKAMSRLEAFVGDGNPERN